MSEAHFDEIAGEYDESLPPHVVEHYLQQAGSTSSVEHCSRRVSAVLDVGCGTGVLASPPREAGYEVTGIDPSEGMLERARAERPVGRAPCVASGTELPFEDDSFDLVYCVAAMHHIAAPDAVRGPSRRWCGSRSQAAGSWSGTTTPATPTGAPDGAGAAGHRRGAADPGGRDPRRPARRRGRAGPAQRSSGWSPTSSPPALLGVAAGAERIAERTPGLRRLCAHNVILAAKR